MAVTSSPLSADRLLAALAARQYGVFALWQALAAGVSRQAVQRRFALGRLHRVHARPKPGRMVEGLDASFDALLCVGSHERAGGGDGVLNHTRAAHRGAGAAPLGSVKLKRVPRPGAESSQIRPPWPSTISLQIARPRPVPGYSSLVCRRWKSSKIRAW